MNAALVELRRLAYQGVDGQVLADLLDLVEYLPRLLADADDRTNDFRNVLVDLVARRAEFQLALDRFDHPSTPW
ncbi:MAG: hypothetical protein IPH07_14585 [Deltaproteobacteria bacterium]|nr:hypothetical protein [Deltaproteobacteria bacterium]MBK8239003.1 hypothetical protein [Deltaproteobacteria bacterium]MBK8717517.1 hypothetical protein [Deltaproteobacteria bacterium]